LTIHEYWGSYTWFDYADCYGVVWKCHLLTDLRNILLVHEKTVEAIPSSVPFEWSYWLLLGAIITITFSVQYGFGCINQPFSNCGNRVLIATFTFNSTTEFVVLF
jgi:hypothetical protein